MENFEPNSLQSDGKRIVETSVRFRMWWLTWFRGYKLTNLRRLPKVNFFGEIYYKNVWVVSKDNRARSEF